MTDNSNDALRQHVDQLGDTPGSATTKGRHAGPDAGQAPPEADGRGRVGRIGNTGVAPDWMQEQVGKGQAVNRDASGVPTEVEKERTGSDR